MPPHNPTRRRFLAGTTGALALTAGCIDQAQSLVTGGYSGFETLDWVNLDVLEVTFSEDHTMDGFGIGHQHTDDPEDLLSVCQAPEFSGPIRLPVIDMIRREDTVYPSRNFKAVAYTGTFAQCGYRYGANLITETLGSQGFEIPASIMPSSHLAE